MVPFALYRFHYINLCAISEGLVGDNAGEDEPERQRRDDEQGGGHPNRRIAQRHNAEIVNGLVQIQPRHHDGRL